MRSQFFLLKNFASNQRIDWEREIEVLERIEKDGGHPNVIKHLWHSEGMQMSVCRSVGRSVGMVHRLVCLLVGDGLVGWLVGWFKFNNVDLFFVVSKYLS
jgi:hypothetical protein